MRDDHFTHTEADAGAYERQRAQDDYDPPDVDEPCICSREDGPEPGCVQHGPFITTERQWPTC